MEAKKLEIPPGAKMNFFGPVENPLLSTWLLFQRYVAFKRAFFSKRSVFGTPQKMGKYTDHD